MNDEDDFEYDDEYEDECDFCFGSLCIHGICTDCDLCDECIEEGEEGE